KHRLHSPISLSHYRDVSPVIFQRELDQRVLAMQLFFSKITPEYIRYLHGCDTVETQAHYHPQHKYAETHKHSNKKDKSTSTWFNVFPFNQKHPEQHNASYNPSVPDHPRGPKERTRSYSDSEIDLSR